MRPDRERPWSEFFQRAGPFEGGRGFPTTDRKPKVVFSKVRGKKGPADFYDQHEFWVISPRLKTLLENIVHVGFDFIEAETRYNGGLENGPNYWLADIVRLSDCIEESASDIVYQTDSERKHYTFVRRARVKSELVDGWRIWRLLHGHEHVICDDVFVAALNDEGVTGCLFSELVE